jgi:hypothetical protein
MRRFILMTVLPAAGFAVAAPAAAHDNSYSGREYRQHERLERQHDRADGRLEQQHDAAHYYGITRRQDRRLHRQLDRQEDRIHHRLEDRHDRQHDRRW